MKSLYPINETLQKILDRIPETPGVYQYFDKEGQIIYVGKAKNLRKRVYSYFTKTHEESPKTKVLVKKIHDLKYIVVNSEEDALLLENNLIKQYTPRYNVMLKDDKTYPSICIKKEKFPRVFMTRRIIKDGSTYFGPYSSAMVVKNILSLIKQIYKIRTCPLLLSETNIKTGKFRVCLNYHIKKCKGPCVGYQSEEEYNKNISEIKEILKGNIKSIENVLLKEMEEYSEKLEFEKAQEVKEKYEKLELYESKSAVVSSHLNNIDVYAYEELDNSAIINSLHISNGCITKGYTVEYKKRVEEGREEILSSGIFELRKKFESNSKEIIVQFKPEIIPDNVKITIPKGGEKSKILKLSIQNAKQYKIDLQKQKEKLNPEQRTTRILSTMKRDLKMEVLPRHIECFDNSNIQGTNPVASCVVFKNAKPSKKDYRHFNIKTVTGANDFASMEEIITRRYTRLVNEKQPLPQLIIVDGGKGQLSSAVEALRKIDLFEKITIIGIAKNLEEIFFPEDNIPLYLDKNSETLKLIQNLRDEAHRFGITHHRNKRSKQQIKSELDDIKGVGEKTKMALLREFGSVKKIKEASFDNIAGTVGNSKAKIITGYFDKKPENSKN